MSQSFVPKHGVIQMSDLMKDFWYRLETLKQLFSSFKGAVYL
ncbi:hypothetical protein B834_824 [Enterococcus mundtii 1A]|nr:hypothetical protein [Enterococcus mundtii 1A]